MSSSKSVLALLSAFLSAALFLGCDSSPAVDDDRIVEGVNFTELFAEPTAAEKAAVLAEWQARDVAVRGLREEAQLQRQIAGAAFDVRVVSHTVGDVRHYGAVLAPAGRPSASLPVLMYLHGGDAGVSIDEEVIPLLGTMGELIEEFVVVVPSFRDEPLIAGGQAYLSEGPASPWDYDVDDALAFLAVALGVAPAADEERVGVLGFSRGAGVGLLMAIRDPRIDRVVSFFGPTDFMGPFVQEVVEKALRGELEPLPGLDFLNARFIEPLRQGEISEQAVREELIRRSAVLFAERLPILQVHHGTADDVVPVSQALALDAAMTDLGRAAPDYELLLYEGYGHGLFTIVVARDATLDFLSPLTSMIVASR